MKITKLGWDSDFFGFPVGKINGEGINSSDELDIILKEAKGKSYRLCYLMILPSDNLSVSLKKSGKRFLADEKVTYSIGEIKNTELTDLNNVTEFDASFPVDEMYSLAVQSSHQSRFKLDKNFDAGCCDKMYKIWIDRSITGELADKIFVYKENDSIKGMITVYVKNDTGNIGLVGVDSGERGKNIGKKLIRKTFEYLIRNKISRVDVNTQKRNAEACRFYEKCGFSVSKIIDIYHFWL